MVSSSQESRRSVDCVNGIPVPVFLHHKPFLRHLPLKGPSIQMIPKLILIILEAQSSLGWARWLGVVVNNREYAVQVLGQCC
jgi:hypothetical protein